MAESTPIKQLRIRILHQSWLETIAPMKNNYSIDLNIVIVDLGCLWKFRIIDIIDPLDIRHIDYTDSSTPDIEKEASSPCMVIRDVNCFDLWRVIYISSPQPRSIE